MNAKRLSKRILEGMLIGATVFGNLKDVSAPAVDTEYTYEIHRQLKWDRIAREQNADGLRVPYVWAPSNYCARYAVNTANKLFNKNYNSANAWDLKYENPVVYNFDKEKEVKDAIIDGNLTQGMLVTSKWPVKNIKTYGKRGFDKKGNPIDATHVVEYIGIGRKTDKEILDLPEPIFLHQWGSRKEKKTQKQLWDDYELEFIRIINDKEFNLSD